MRSLYPVRKAHNAGRNHLTNVRDYYSCMFALIFTRYVQRCCDLRANSKLPSRCIQLAALGSDRAQELIDQITRAYENGGGGVARQLPMNAGMMGPPMGGPPGGSTFNPLFSQRDVVCFSVSIRLAHLILCCTGMGGPPPGYGGPPQFQVGGPPLRFGAPGGPPMGMGGPPPGQFGAPPRKSLIE